MKNTFNILIISLLFLIFSAQKTDKPAMEFNQTVFNAGKVKLNSKITHRYEFINNSKSPLIIFDVKTTCGCTASKWTHKPVSPKRKGFVELTFEAESIGKFSKTAYVSSNAKNSPVVLKITGEVIE